MPVLLLSILLSIIVWTYAVSLKFAIIIIVAIFIHEYGHFYWMGREGIKNKDMFFMPPFGAVARAKEPWTSYGAELRIALAGPTAGLLSVLLFYLLWLAYQNDIFMAAVLLACLINLFNLLLPIPILDGGRVIKSILYSINRSLGDGFYIFGIFALGFALIYGYLSLLFVGLIGYFLYQDWNNVLYMRNRLRELEEKRVTYLASESGETRNIFNSTEKEYLFLNSLVNMGKMSPKEIAFGASFYISLILTYVFIMYVAIVHMPPGNVMQYFLR